jgi:hypothetical protein
VRGFSLAKQSKRKRKKTPINKIRDEKGDLQQIPNKFRGIF